MLLWSGRKVRACSNAGLDGGSIRMASPHPNLPAPLHRFYIPFAPAKGGIISPSSRNCGKNRYTTGAAAALERPQTTRPLQNWAKRVEYTHPPRLNPSSLP